MVVRWIAVSMAAAVCWWSHGQREDLRPVQEACSDCNATEYYRPGVRAADHSILSPTGCASSATAQHGYLVGLVPDAARNLTTFLRACLTRIA